MNNIVRALIDTLVIVFIFTACIGWGVLSLALMITGVINIGFNPLYTGHHFIYGFILFIVPIIIVLFSVSLSNLNNGK